MANMFLLLLLHVLVVLGIALTSNAATTYMVGDNSGWDISTNLDAWVSGKKFQVGDALVFQYSSSHSVDEVTKQSFDSCNTTNVVNTYSNGNTTVPLTKPGSRYFLCGNKLHCLGGMKLQVNVEGDEQAASASPIGAPESQPSSKSNNPPSFVPSSSGYSIIWAGKNSAFLGIIMATVLWVAV